MVKTIYKNPCVNSQSHPVIPNYAVKTALCTCKILDARAKRASRIARALASRIASRIALNSLQIFFVGSL